MMKERRELEGKLKALHDDFDAKQRAFEEYRAWKQYEERKKREEERRAAAAAAAAARKAAWEERQRKRLEEQAEAERNPWGKHLAACEGLLSYLRSSLKRITTAEVCSDALPVPCVLCMLTRARLCCVVRRRSGRQMSRRLRRRA